MSMNIINIWIIKKYISKCQKLDNFDKERIVYALNIILSETEKFIGIILIFSVWGKLASLMISFVVLMSLRIFIGGLHFLKSYQCFVFTLIFFCLSVIMSEFIIVNKAIGFILCCLALVNIVLCAPLQSKHRALVSERGNERLRNGAVIIMIIWMICYIIFNRSISNLILWTIVMQQLEILYYKYFRKVG